MRRALLDKSNSPESATAHRSHFASYVSTGEANLLAGVLGAGPVGSIALFVLSLPRDPRHVTRCAMA
jgi:hypothetical protein